MDELKGCTPEGLFKELRFALGSRENESLLVTAYRIRADRDELLAASKSFIAWFDELRKEQYEKTKSSLKEACENWDTFGIKSYDTTQMRKAIARTEE